VPVLLVVPDSTRDDMARRGFKQPQLLWAIAGAAIRLPISAGVLSRETSA